MENDDAVNATTEVTTEPTFEDDMKDALATVVACMRAQDKRMDKQDEMIAMQQTAIKLLGEALKGHQQIIEASQPEVAPGPPKPPAIVH